MTTDTKKGLICIVLAVGLTWTIVYFVNKEKKRDKEDKQPAITEQNIKWAVDAYKAAMDAGEPKENLDEVNEELKKEYGLTVEFNPLKTTYIVRDLSGKKVKES
jgi:hypothetical protein